MNLSVRKPKELIEHVYYCYFYTEINKIFSFQLVLNISINHVYLFVLACSITDCHKKRVSHVPDAYFIYLDDVQGCIDRRRLRYLDLH